MKFIGFNKPYMSGNELTYIEQALLNMKISGDGEFTKKCHRFFEDKYGFHKVLLTTSCTDALEMAAILADIKPGDEVIAPSYTFVSTVNAFMLRGAKIVFADSANDSPNMDVSLLPSLITDKTKAIIPVHYAGIAVDMDQVQAAVAGRNILIIEDAAQAIDSYYKGKPLGSIGDLAAFSFHETKNIISGEGGMLVINNPEFSGRAEIIREKGTNRSAFFRGEVDKYNWVDIGSSFLPSDMIAAFLYAQLESMDLIQSRRKAIWNLYYEGLKNLEEKGFISLPLIPDYATNNAHMFYLVCRKAEERDALVAHLKSHSVQAVFHYLSLHKSNFYKQKHDGRELPMADHYSDCLLRLPFYFELDDDSVNRISGLINEFYEKL
ncbi:MAG: dTDP-4-amino-4,6-dideoxygalactose transaminase [Bacteroidia bacterium]